MFFNQKSYFFLSAGFLFGSAIFASLVCMEVESQNNFLSLIPDIKNEIVQRVVTGESILQEHLTSKQFYASKSLPNYGDMIGSIAEQEKNSARLSLVNKDFNALVKAVKLKNQEAAIFKNARYYDIHPFMVALLTTKNYHLYNQFASEKLCNDGLQSYDQWEFLEDEEDLLQKVANKRLFVHFRNETPEDNQKGVLQSIANKRLFINYFDSNNVTPPSSSSKLLTKIEHNFALERLFHYWSHLKRNETLQNQKKMRDKSGQLIFHDVKSFALERLYLCKNNISYGRGCILNGFESRYNRYSFERAFNKAHSELNNLGIEYYI